jgi:hypothetical protein
VIITGLPGNVYNYYGMAISYNTSGLSINGNSSTTNGSILLTDNSGTNITYAQMSGKVLSASITYRNN